MTMMENVSDYHWLVKTKFNESFVHRLDYVWENMVCISLIIILEIDNAPMLMRNILW